MKAATLTINYSHCLPSELDPLRSDLCKQACEATTGSYAPYSNFLVGAALRLDDGTVVRGANQENAAYPSGTCAERTAVYSAGALHPGQRITHLAIAAKRRDSPWQESPISPCGACRQALLEYEAKQGSPIEVILFGSEDVLVFPSVASLLPLCFTEF